MKDRSEPLYICKMLLTLAQVFCAIWTLIMTLSGYTPVAEIYMVDALLVGVFVVATVVKAVVKHQEKRWELKHLPA